MKDDSALKQSVDQAKALYVQHFASDDATSPAAKYCSTAPGRVNLIGEHTDYNGGFVLPFAIDYATVIYGTGSLDQAEAPCASIRFVSSNFPEAVKHVDINLTTTPYKQPDWTSYVVGTIFQYLPDIPKSNKLNLTFSIDGSVPLGSGLSSSASLEVAVARFVESILGEHAFSSDPTTRDNSYNPRKMRALRCQKAENVWCQSPCGIMDQYVSSAASEGALLLIDCTTLDYKEIKMAESNNRPVLVVTNSNVQHDIAGGEYPVRVAQCKVATAALAKVNSTVTTLRDATLEDVQKAKDLMVEDGHGTVSYRRAHHVVTENDRTLRAKDALEVGDWSLVGSLMNASHTSMRDDYEVSCEEIDILVDLAQSYNGVYGSRLTGGGFGGCTVTLVKEERASDLISLLQKEYKSKTGKECSCFQTSPAPGARLLAVTD